MPCSERRPQSSVLSGEPERGSRYDMLIQVGWGNVEVSRESISEEMSLVRCSL